MHLVDRQRRRERRGQLIAELVLSTGARREAGDAVKRRKRGVAARAWSGIEYGGTFPAKRVVQVYRPTRVRS
jgi:hypothetical protein